MQKNRPVKTDSSRLVIVVVVVVRGGGAATVAVLLHEMFSVGLVNVAQKTTCVMSCSSFGALMLLC